MIHLSPILYSHMQYVQRYYKSNGVENLWQFFCFCETTSQQTRTIIQYTEYMEIHVHDLKLSKTCNFLFLFCFHVLVYMYMYWKGEVICSFSFLFVCNEVEKHVVFFTMRLILPYLLCNLMLCNTFNIRSDVSKMCHGVYIPMMYST